MGQGSYLAVARPRPARRTHRAAGTGVRYCARAPGRSRIPANRKACCEPARESATLVEVIDAARGDDTYYVLLRGEEVRADYGWFIPDPTPGTTVEVVRDPENPSRVIAVGTPQDWADRPWLNWVLAAVTLAVGLLAAFFAGLKLVPERAGPTLERLFKARERMVRQADHALRERLGRGSLPSGRHSSP
jgi:hypothetical protein